MNIIKIANRVAEIKDYSIDLNVKISKLNFRTLRFDPVLLHDADTMSRITWDVEGTASIVITKDGQPFFSDTNIKWSTTMPSGRHGSDTGLHEKFHMDGLKFLSEGQDERLKDTIAESVFHSIEQVSFVDEDFYDSPTDREFVRDFINLITQESRRAIGNTFDGEMDKARVDLKDQILGNAKLKNHERNNFRHQYRRSDL